MQAELNDAMGSMTVDQLMQSIPHLLDELGKSVPLEKRAEFNVVRQQAQSAMIAGDLSVIEDLHKKFNPNNESVSENVNILQTVLNIFKKK